MQILPQEDPYQYARPAVQQLVGNLDQFLQKRQMLQSFPQGQMRQMLSYLPAGAIQQIMANQIQSQMQFPYQMALRQAGQGGQGQGLTPNARLQQVVREMNQINDISDPTRREKAVKEFRPRWQQELSTIYGEAISPTMVDVLSGEAAEKEPEKESRAWWHIQLPKATEAEIDDIMKTQARTKAPATTYAPSQIEKLRREGLIAEEDVPRAVNILTGVEPRATAPKEVNVGVEYQRYANLVKNGAAPAQVTGIFAASPAGQQWKQDTGLPLPDFAEFVPEEKGLTFGNYSSMYRTANDVISTLMPYGYMPSDEKSLKAIAEAEKIRDFAQSKIQESIDKEKAKTSAATPTGTEVVSPAATQVPAPRKFPPQINNIRIRFKRELLSKPEILAAFESLDEETQNRYLMQLDNYTRDQIYKAILKDAAR